MAIIDLYLEALATGAEKLRLPIDVIRGIYAALQRSGDFYRLHHDFETYCEANLSDTGSDVYARHPSCEALMCAWAVNDSPVAQWIPAQGQKMPRELDEILRDPNCVKFAWNKPFEWAIWQHVLDRFIPHAEWKDPMVLAFSLSLPGKLEKVGEIIGLPEDKRKIARGKALIRKFCVPVKPTKKHPHTRWYWHDAPEDWQEFLEYNRNDVEAERASYQILKRWDMPPEEWEMWVLDQEINQAGIPINMNMVENGIHIYEHIMDETMTELRDITGLTNPNSQQQILGWLQDKGYPFEDVKAGHLKIYRQRLLDHLEGQGIDEDQQQEILFESDPDSPKDDLDTDVFLKRVIELRLIGAKSSPKKYYALKDACDASDPDNVVIRNCFQFAGAGRTWRWSGRLYQAQNLPKPATKELEKDIKFVAHIVEHLSAPAITAFYPEVMDVLTTAVRPCAQAPDGYVFVGVDLNAIENRVLGWIAKCRKILEVFYAKRDPYISFATYLFGGSYDELLAEYKGGDGFKRTIAKPGTLGCGYMLSAGKTWLNEDTGEDEADGLLGYAWNMGIKEFTHKQSELSVKTFRSEFDEVVDFWYDLEKAFRKCVNTGRSTEHHMIRFERDGVFVKMILPSGRPLYYCRPRVEDRMKPWGKIGPTLTYEGMGDNRNWGRITTHPGKVTENADQAIARDIFVNGMKIARYEYGIQTRIHVHDEIVATVREDVAEQKLKQLEEAMSRDIWWAPGLPLGAKGSINKLFVKD